MTRASPCVSKAHCQMTREYKYEGVVVKTFKGTVQLSGFVDTSAQKSKAASIAKGVEGVKELENNITVKD